MIEDVRGPIEHFSWAKFIIEGKEHSRDMGEGKDIMVFGTEVSPWKDMGGHRLTPGSVEVLCGRDVEVLVIGNGVYGMVKVSDEVRKAIRDIGIRELIVEKTARACDTYNRLYNEERKAALLAHGTC